MKKYYIIFCLCFLISFDASATIKADVAEASQGFIGTVKTNAETAGKAINESAVLKHAKQLKANIDEQKARISDAVGEVTSEIDARKEEINKARGDVEGLKDQANSTVGEAGGLAGEAAGTVGSATSAAGGVASKAGPAQELLALEKEKSLIEAEYNQNIESLKADNLAIQGDNGKLANIDANISKYKTQINSDPANALDYQSQIDSYEAEKAPLSQSIDANNAEISRLEQEKAEKVSGVSTRISALKQQAASQAGGAAIGKAKALFAGGDDSAALQEKKSKELFLDPEAAASTERVEKLKMELIRKARDYNIDAYAKGSTIKYGEFARKEVAKAMQKESAIAETTSDSTTVATQIIINNTQGLLDYTEAVLIKMKAKIANDLTRLPIRKMESADRKKGVLNLCNYKFAKKEAESRQKKFIKGLKSAKGELDSVGGVSGIKKSLGGML